MMDYRKLLISLAITQATGLIGAIFTLDAIPTWYAGLVKPIFAPPNWLFGPVWTLLYLMMGISLYLVWRQKSTKINKKKIDQTNCGLYLFVTQLFFNFIWSPVFFGLQSPLAALVIIIMLWGLIVATIKVFYPLSKAAAYLLVPYLLWVSFATILNASIAWLN